MCQNEAKFLSRLGPVCLVPDRSIAGAPGHDRQRPLHCYDLWYVLMVKTGEELPVKYEGVSLFSVLHNKNYDIGSRYEGWNRQTIRII